MEIIDAIARKDVPKCVRRNVLGADFLAIFCDLALDMSLQGSERIREFYDSASELVQNDTRFTFDSDAVSDTVQPTALR